MKNKIIIYIISILLLLIIGLGITGYYFYTQYKTTKESLQLSKNINKQNDQHYKDILNQKEDSIQVLAGLIKKLNKENFDIKQKWTTQVTSLQLQIQSIQVQDTAHEISGKDSIGEYIQVSFNGKQSIINYEGFTKHYFGLNKNFYRIGITFDSIQIHSSFYRDVDNIWKIETKSLTPGVNLLVNYYIDSTFYSKLDGSGNPESDKEEELTSFGIRLKAGVVGSWMTDSWYTQHTLDASVELYYRFLHITYYPLQKAAGFGIYYDLNLSKPLNFVKKVFSIF
jgi:hypothetical protein